MNMKVTIVNPIYVSYNKKGDLMSGLEKFIYGCSAIMAVLIQTLIWITRIMLAITCGMLKGFMYFSLGFLAGFGRGVKKWKF